MTKKPGAAGTGPLWREVKNAREAPQRVFCPGGVPP
jgi:hypothetical protein